MPQPALFEPITLRKLKIRNRVWVPPMCQYSAHDGDGMPQPWHSVHYGAMARGGAGLIIIEATGVTPEGRISPFCLGLWNDEQAAEFARIVDFVHRQGSAIAIQLAHAGRKGSTYPWMPDAPAGSVPLDEGGWQTVAPSAVAFDGYAAPQELTPEAITEIVEAFRAAATRAVRAGFDAVEVHAAHGYLLHEFLSPLSNLRSDEYGGSLENRARVLRRIVSSIRLDHPELPVFVRLSATEWVDDGFDLAQAEQVAEWMREDGADLVDVSSAGNTASPKIPVGPGYQVPLAEAIRERADIAVAAVGMITDAQQAEAIVRNGQADVVLVGRGALNDPHIALRWAKELGADPLPVPDPLWRAWR